MKKAIIILLTVIVIFNCFYTIAFSHDIPDLDQNCSISITMHYGNAVVAGGAMTIYRVGDIIEMDGNYFFELIDELTGINVALDDLESEKLVERLEIAVGERKIEGTSKAIDLNGNVKYNDLTCGLYLVVQEASATGYNPAKSFLVSLPSYNDGSYVYNVDASAKTELEASRDTTFDKNTSHRIDKDDEPGLPQTGQLKWPIPILAVSGVALVAMGWILCYVNGKNNEA